MKRKKAFLHWYSKDEADIESRLTEAEEDMKYVMTLLRESDQEPNEEDYDEDEYDDSDSEDY